MRRLKLLFVSITLVLACLFIVSCSATAQTGKPTGQEGSPAVSASATTGTQQPAVTSTPTPTPEQATDSPSASASPTAQPSDTPLDASNYNVVRINDRAGIVDKNGRVVLKPSFASVSIISQYDVISEDYVPFGTPLFFAVPVQEGSAGAARNQSGYLYGTAGKQISNTRFHSAEALSDGLFLVMKTGSYDAITSEGEDHEPQEAVSGVISTTGEMVLPMKYYRICAVGGVLAALRNGDVKGTLTVDFFTGKGAPIGSVPAASSYTYDMMTRYGGNLLALRSENGHMGLINSQLQWALPAQWDRILYNDATGGFYLTRDGLTGIADKTGKIIVAAQYKLGEDSNYWHSGCYILAKGKEQFVFDATGKTLYHSDRYKAIVYSHELLLARSGAQTDIYDLAGNLHLSITDNIAQYLPDTGYFVSDHSRFYTADGKKLPLPSEADWTQCLSADRFLVTTTAGSSGLCDAKGRWIMKPIYNSLRTIGGNLLAYGVAGSGSTDESGNIYGLATMDGKILTEPVFYSLDGYSKGLIYVETATMSGLMDENLKWVWNTTVYDTLLD